MVEGATDNSTHRTVTVMLLLSRFMVQVDSQLSRLMVEEQADNSTTHSLYSSHNMVEEQADNSNVVTFTSLQFSAHTVHRTVTVMLLLSRSTVITAHMVEEQTDNSTHRTVTVMLLLSRLYCYHSTHGGRASRQLDS